MVFKEKKGEFNFVWLFAIIAGTAILLLAIFGAVKYGMGTSTRQNTEIAKALAVVTDSMQAGFASGRLSTVNFKKDTLISNECFTGSFGYSEISAMTQERSSDQFEVFGNPISVNNKYLFISDKPAKNFYIFSVPISFAFKIADAIIIDSQEYCFTGLDDESDILSMLGVLGKKAKFGDLNCTEDSIKVCFGGGGSGCDINVLPSCNSFSCQSEYETGIVEKDTYSLDYAGNLLYPAIFSEEESYLCNVQRLLYRQHILAEMYSKKIDFMGARNCNVDLGLELEALKGESFDASLDLTGFDLADMYQGSLDIKDKEDRGSCRLWS